jgi:signal peptidase I
MGPKTDYVARSVLDWALRAFFLGAIVVFMLLGVMPHLGKYRTVSVLSGSMNPTFSPGDLIILQPEPLRDVKVGQVIAYKIPVDDNHVETHRIVRVLHGGNTPVVETQGDANSVRDPWIAKLHGSQAWRLVGVVPGGAWPILYLRLPIVHDLLLFGAPALLVLLGLARIWRAPTVRPVPFPARVAGSDGNARLAA